MIYLTKSFSKKVLRMFKLILLGVTSAFFLICYAEVEMAPEDLVHATKFLKSYGYMHPEDEGTAESMKEAVTEMQKFAGLEASGELNKVTLTKMKSERCGLPDMDASGGKAKRYSTLSKWTTNKFTYTILNSPSNRSACLTDAKIKEFLEYVFGNWSKASNGKLTFEPAPTGQNGTIIISFGNFAHGDKWNFDGTGTVVAHGFYPQNGKLHFDDSEFWGCFRETLKGTTYYLYFLEVSLHEMGHVMGLGHSEVEGAVMGPYYSGKTEKMVPTQDDIDGIISLYGA